MTEDLKAQLHSDLREAREALIWKLEGLSDYEVRRPMVRSGTNLLGLLKHMTGLEVGYFGDTFGRPFGERLSWFTDDAEPNSDMWATAEEGREWMVDLYRRAQAHADAVISELPLDTLGKVPWWGPDNQVSLLRILSYMSAETSRHAGHADILRELIDGSVGWRRDDASMPSDDEEWWEQYRRRLEQVAREAGGRAG